MSLDIRVDVAVTGFDSAVTTNVFNAIELGDRPRASSFASRQSNIAPAALPVASEPELSAQAAVPSSPPSPEGARAGADPAVSPIPAPAAPPSASPAPAAGRLPPRQAALPPPQSPSQAASRGPATDIPHAVGPHERGINMDIDPTLAGALRAMRRDAPAGTPFQVISGRRSRELQAELYRRYITGRGGLAARPGHSRHEVGQAVDVRDPTGWYHRNASRYGLGFPVRGDYPHMQVTNRALAARVGIRRAPRPAASPANAASGRTPAPPPIEE